MKYNNSRYTIHLPIVIVVSIILGIFLGRVLWSRDQRSPGYTGSNSKIDMALSFIAKNYVDSISEEKLEEDAIPALLSKLDPHSAYIPASEFNEVNDPLEGSFEGIGVQFNMQNDTVVVMQVISGGPSEKVNIRAGDRIVKVDDTVIAGKKISTSDVVHKLKGPRGTKVKVGIARRGTKGLTEFVITRDKIPFYSIDASFMVNNTTGYIKISRFATTTYDEFMDHARKLKQKGMTRLIIDLRGNGGGVLQASTLIANEFVEAGKLIVYTEGRTSPRENYTADETGSFHDTKLAILVDEETASASEILAGAIQDNDRGTIVGRRSFGKGLVMDQQMFPDGSALRLTISRYYTPTGRCIQKPYDEDHEKYYQEIEERYMNKEFERIDSTKFPDSLKFVTPGGKIVYGGGGIMPDVFVPLDTTGYSKFYSAVSNKGLIYDFAFDWADNHRDNFSSLKSGLVLNNKLKELPIFDEFIRYATKQGVKGNAKDIATSKQTIINKINQLIVRDIMGDEQFYSLWTTTDKTVLRALKTISVN